MNHTASTATAERRRGFQVIVTDSDGTNYGMRVAETNGHPDHTIVVASVRPTDMPRVTEAMQTALRASHKPVTTIGPARKRPVEIDESPGVRLVLTALAVAPIRRRDRARMIVEGVASMSDEEAYYWYAKATSVRSGSRSLRALRLLLADDGQ